MFGLIFQIWFILFIGLLLFFNDSRSFVITELLVASIGSGLFFFLWQRKKVKELESYFFVFSSLGLILYTSITGIIFLPDRLFEQQQVYLKFIFLISILGFLFLWRFDFDKRLLVFYSVIASSQVYIYRYHYSSIAILFYLIANLYLLKKFSLSRKNIFDLLVFLLLIASIVSTYTSFFYNGTNSVFGFFHVLSGILLYLYFKYLEKETDILRVIQFNQFFYCISLIFYLIISFYKFEGISSNNFFEPGGFQFYDMSGVIAVNLPTLVVLSLFLKDSFKMKIFIYFILFLSLVVVAVARSEAAIIGVLVANLFLFVYTIKRKMLNQKNIAILSSFSLLLILIFTYKFFSIPGFLSLDLFSRRFSIWTLYTERVLHHSILFGFGSNNEAFNIFLPVYYLSEKTIINLKYFFTNFQTIPHSYNLYIQFFYNYGLYGLGILTSILVFLFFSIIKKIQGRLTVNEMLGYCILISIFFQEIFDYTLPDAVTFFPTAFALGILSRYAFQLNSFSYLKSFSTVNIKIIYGMQFFIALFISLLGFNLCISEKIKTLFRNEYTMDSFSNLKFRDSSIFTEAKLKRFRKLDNLYLTINLDDKKEQFSGQVYLEAFKINRDKKDLELAEKNFQKCILIFPNSAVCYKKLIEVENLKDNPLGANGYFQKYSDNDPFGVVE